MPHSFPYGIKILSSYYERGLTKKSVHNDDFEGTLSHVTGKYKNYRGLGSLLRYNSSSSPRWLMLCQCMHFVRLVKQPLGIFLIPPSFCPCQKSGSMQMHNKSLQDHIRPDILFVNKKGIMPIRFDPILSFITW